jgi:hypothetical protein
MNGGLKLWLGGGLGDCLSALSLWMPIPSACARNPSLKLYVTYGGQKYNDCGWKHIIQDLAYRIDFVRWVEPEQFSLIPAIDVRERTTDKLTEEKLNKLFEGCEHTIAPNIALHLPEKFIINNLPSKYIAIQLGSNDHLKVWGRENFKALILRLIEETDLPIVLLDGPETPPFDLKHPRVISLIGVNFPTSIHVIMNASYLITADSWSKYAARWKRIPQVILCAELPYLEPKRMINECFGWLKDEPNIILLGVEKKEEDVKIIKHVKEISVEQVIENFKKL